MLTATSASARCVGEDSRSRAFRPVLNKMVKIMSRQTFELDEEMTLMAALCDKMKVIYKIEILRDHDSRPISMMFYVSTPQREAGWVNTVCLEDFVRVMGKEKVARF